MANRDVALNYRVPMNNILPAMGKSKAVAKRTFWRRIIKISLMFSVAVMVTLAVIKLSLFLGAVRVTKITILGNKFLSEEEVSRLSGIALGQNIENVSQEEVAESLFSHPQIMSVAVDKSLSGEVVLTVTERVPLALIHLGDTLAVVDNNCCIYDTRGEVQGGELPLVGPSIFEDANGDARIESDDLKAVVSILAQLRQNNLYLGGRISYFDVDKLKAYTLDGVTVLFARENEDQQLVRASAVYRLAVEKGWVGVDARFKDRIIVNKGEIVKSPKPKTKEA
jgi:cell division protein FtsQ